MTPGEAWILKNCWLRSMLTKTFFIDLGRSQGIRRRQEIMTSSHNGYAPEANSMHLSADIDLSGEDVRQIIDFESIQELMNSFYKLTKIGVALIGLNGDILVATGWQDICRKFHRVHPQTLANCIESDTCLSQNTGEDKYSIYKCKNNLWDMATPITVGGKCIARLFLGQFLFEDEEPDRELFSRQAEAYGFDKEEYLAALDRVPRRSRETVSNVTDFYSHLAGMVAELSYSNIRLAKALVERKRTEHALLESERLLACEKRFCSLFENMLEGVAYCRMLYDDDGRPADFIYLDVNSAFSEQTGLHDVVGKLASELIPGMKESCPDMLEVYGRVALTGQPEKCEIYVKPLSLWRSMSVYSSEKGYFVSVSENITGRKRIESELQESHYKLKQLTAHLNQRRERERKAIARKVHDELGTTLTLIKFDLAWLKRHCPTDDPTVTERIRGMEELIHEGTNTVQRITSELRPSLLDEQGLTATIEWQVKKFETRTGISCALKTEDTLPALSQDKSINTFRIIQESLSNIMRHANATKVEITLVKSGENIDLRITDNGVGISDLEISATTSFGILGMEERAHLCGGTITIQGFASKGTTIHVSIPILNGETHHA